LKPECTVLDRIWGLGGFFDGIRKDFTGL